MRKIDEVFVCDTIEKSIFFLYIVSYDFSILFFRILFLAYLQFLFIW